MLAKLTPDIPEGDGWLFEPKWDGFRCIVSSDGQEPPYPGPDWYQLRFEVGDSDAWWGQ